MSAPIRSKITTAAPANSSVPLTSKKTKAPTKVEDHTNLQMLKVLTQQLESKLRKNEYSKSEIVSIYPKFVGLQKEETDKELLGNIGKVIELMNKKLDPKTISALLKQINSK